MNIGSRNALKEPKKTEYGIVKAWEVNGVGLEGQPVKFAIYAVHAESGKTLRAEMVSSRYLSNQVHHPETRLPTCEIKTCRGNVEDQMCSWDPETFKSSPDRLDALVYCLLHIFGGNSLTKTSAIVARPKVHDTPTSQFESNQRKKAMVGVYSMDIDGGTSSSSADRALIPFLRGETDFIPESSIYNRHM